MKRALSVILTLMLFLGLCPAVFADAVPPGLKRPSDDYMKNLCSQANSKGSDTTWDYDEASGALILSIPYGTTKSLISIVIDADAGDSTASLFATLLDRMGKDMCYTMAQQFYDMGYYVNIVVRYTDDLHENAVGAEFIDGVRSAYRPPAEYESTAEQTTVEPIESTESTESEDIDAGDEYTPTISEQNALKKAQSYLKHSAFSMWGLVDQLMYDGFSEEDATYGAWYTGADWYEQAVRKAESYLKYSAFSRDGLIRQLEYDQFSPEEAEYAANMVGF